MNENLKKAIEEKNVRWEIPEFEIGERLAIGYLWDGDGENPAINLDDPDNNVGSFSIMYYDGGIGGTDEWINYIFKPTGNMASYNGYKDDPELSVEVEIIDIDLV